MNYKSVFRMPTPVKITGRTSSITNAFINGILPCIIPSEEEIKTVLSILRMDMSSICCAYCGDKFTEWDHFRPLIENKRATGYISEINNLVPSCGKCNQSKGNSPWKSWITGPAKLSPRTRKIVNIKEKIQRLEEYEKWSKPLKLDFEKIVGKEKWEQHWKNCELLHEQMKESQQLSDEIKKTIGLSLSEETTVIKKSILSENLLIEKTYKKKSTHSDEILQQLSNKKVGIIAQTIFKDFLESDRCNPALISYLQNENYSKDTFLMNFPILVKINELCESEINKKKIDNKGRPRYYTDLLRINNERYLLTSQWYDRNKPYLIKWLISYYV